ncbi:LysR family transcriptional regulator substrate-binding protein [Bacillus megaterium]|nr:LysR family transcriptional regulator substrate-binding protein [Priestia megaterium]
MIPPDKDFDTVPLIKDQLIVLMHSSHPLSQKETISIPDLQGEDILIGKCGYEVQIHALFNEYNLTLKYGLKWII